MPARLAPRLDGDDGSLSDTLGLGDPIGKSFMLAEARLILGRQIKEPSLFAHAFAQPAPLAQTVYSDQSQGGGSDGGDAGGGADADAPDNGSGNDGGDGDG